MNRYILGLPVLVVATPFLLYLLLSGDSAGTDAIRDRPIPKIAEADSIPDAARMEQLANENPVEFLMNCIRRYNRDVKSYRLTMLKQEQIAGKVQPRERIEVYFKNDPHSVCMIWLEGARKAERVLYVEGENNGKMLARPYGSIQRAIAGDIVERDVDGPDARQSGRFPLNKFGLKKSLERALASWEAAREKGALKVKYSGIKPLPEAHNRLCYHLHRVAETPEDDGVLEQTLFIDKETWLPVKILSTGEEGKIVGDYSFLDIQVNPDFKPDPFKPAGLKP